MAGHSRKRPITSGRVDLVRGIKVNERTQCAHYRSSRDIVALKFKCCKSFYACAECHDELADHPAELWLRSERQAHAILCGNCHATCSIADYLASRNSCPRCGAAFNPGCVNHYHLYFEL